MWAVMHKQVFSVFAVGILAAAAALGAAMSPTDEVIAAEKNWAKAVVEQNIPELKRIYSDDLIYAHSTGAIESKEDYLGRMTSGKQRYDVIDHEKTIVRIHGDAAVAHSIVTMKGNNDSGPFDNHLMMIHTWVRTGGRWRLAAHQTTLLPN